MINLKLQSKVMKRETDEIRQLSAHKNYNKIYMIHKKVKVIVLRPRTDIILKIAIKLNLSKLRKSHTPAANNNITNLSALK